MTIQLEQPIIIQAQEEEPKKMASGLHSIIAGKIIGYVFVYLLQQINPSGRVLESSATYNFKDGLPKRQPDVSFASFEKIPLPIDEELTFAPDLAVEVISKYDTVYEVDAKIDQYLNAGVSLVWIVRPSRRVVEVHRPGNIEMTIVGLSGELDGENVLPGFKLPVKNLFE